MSTFSLSPIIVIITKDITNLNDYSLNIFLVIAGTIIMKIKFNMKRLPLEQCGICDNFLILMNMSFDGYFPHTIGRVNIGFSNQINVEFLCLLYIDDCHLSVSGISFYFILFVLLNQKENISRNRQIGLRDWKQCLRFK